MLRRRQVAMHKAREEWNRNAEMLACVQASPARTEMVSMLKQARFESEHHISQSTEYMHHCWERPFTNST